MGGPTTRRRPQNAPHASETTSDLAGRDTAPNLQRLEPRCADDSSKGYGRSMRRPGPVVLFLAALIGAGGLVGTARADTVSKAQKAAAAKVSPSPAERCRSRAHEMKIAGSASVSVLKFTRSSADEGTSIERWIACSAASGKRIRLKTNVADSLDRGADTAQRFRVAGRYITWIDVVGPRFGPYRSTVQTQRFGGKRRSYELPRADADSQVEVAALASSDRGTVAVVTRSQRYGDVLRVLDTRGVARRYDQGGLRSISSPSVTRQGTVSWRHAQFRRRRAPARVDRCETTSARRVLDATPTVTVSQAGACIRATGRVVALPGTVPSTIAQGSIGVSGTFVATVRYDGPNEIVVQVTDLASGAIAGPPLALPPASFVAGKPEYALQQLADGRLVVLAAADGTQPLLLRALDGSTTVLAPPDESFVPIIDDGLLVSHQTGAAEGRLRLAPAAPQR